MLESTNVAETQAVEGEQSQADTTSNASQADVKTPDDEPISLEAARKLRSENKNLRERESALKSTLAGYEAEKLSEAQRLQKQVDVLSGTTAKREGDLKKLLLQTKVDQLKSEFGLRSTKSITKLIDSDALEFDVDSLNVQGVEAELKRIKKEDPDLFISGGTDGGAGGAQRAQTFNMNDLIRSRAGKN